MAWYVSYRTGGSTVMHIFKRREHAIAAACGFLNRGYRDALEVGPMSENPEGTLLNEQDLKNLTTGARSRLRPHQAIGVSSEN